MIEVSWDPELKKHKASETYAFLRETRRMLGGYILGSLEDPAFKHSGFIYIDEQDGSLYHAHLKEDDYSSFAGWFEDVIRSIFQVKDDVINLKNIMSNRDEILDKLAAASIKHMGTGVSLEPVPDIEPERAESILNLGVF